MATAGARALPSVAGAVKWTVLTFLSGVMGLFIGGISIPVVGLALAPGWQLMIRILEKRRA